MLLIAILLLLLPIPPIHDDVHEEDIFIIIKIVSLIYIVFFFIKGI